VELRHLVEVEVVGDDHAVQTLREFQELEVDLFDGREVRVHDLNVERRVALQPVEPVEAAPPALPLVAVGRVGNVLAATVANEAFNRGGNAGYFGSWSALMAVVFIALALVSRHVPRSSAVAAAHAGPAAQR
jgi:hypothetical protein